MEEAGKWGCDTCDPRQGLKSWQNITLNRSADRLKMSDLKYSAI